MRGDDSESSGFSLVEVVVAMFLLGIVAIAFIPPLWQGIGLSVGQSDVAQATRYINAQIEQARHNSSCSAAEPDGTAVFPNPAASLDYANARGETVTVAVTSPPDDPALPSAPYACTPGTAVRVVLTARNVSAEVLAVATAKILMKP